MNHKLCVILVTHNSSPCIDACLASLASQTFNDFHLIFVDNNSTDNSVQWIETICKEHSLSYELVQNRKNVGFAAAVNQGLRLAFLQSDCRAILLLNPDARAEPDVFACGIKCLETESVGACSPKILVSPDIIWWIRGHAHSSTELMLRLNHGYSIGDHLYKELRFAGDIAAHFTCEMDTDYITGCSLFLKRSAVEKTGLFDERFFMYAEDADYSLRLRTAGYRLVAFHCTTVWHDLDPHTDKKNRFRDRTLKYLRYMHSMSLFTRKHFPLPVYILWHMKQPLCLVHNYLRKLHK